uniref:Uncharacterized protein n=1 Tax=Cajanus cajan TaxID=3821 RepID=A0A151TNR4_CAJCA|nr:hypothetical protein KK1_022346 [Cajanus cajan]
MGEENFGTQQEPNIPNSPPLCKIQRNQEDHATLDPCSCPRHPPCSAVAPVKRRSPSSSAQPSAKKLFCDQEDLSLHGFSAVHVPLNLHSLLTKGRSSPVLRRCVSDPCCPPRPSALPPLPPTFRRSVSDLSPLPLPCINCEENTAPDSLVWTVLEKRLRRMKDRLKEMKQLWDEVMEDNDQEDGGGEDFSVEWAEKCLSIIFRCPCGKGYEFLLSENNCYYKLV